MSAENYLSSDDSRLLRSVLSRYSGGTCLEIGAGNGGGLEVLSKSFRLAVGTDLQPPTELHGLEPSQFVLADSASCFREESFDLVAFNPPYVPSDVIEDRTTDGGKGGIEVAVRFLQDAIRVLRRQGNILLVLSSDNPLTPIEEFCNRNGLSIRLLERMPLFYETLCVYEIRTTTCAR